VNQKGEWEDWRDIVGDNQRGLVEEKEEKIEFGG
jgi:hypothetical protein